MSENLQDTVEESKLYVYIKLYQASILHCAKYPTFTGLACTLACRHFLTLAPPCLGHAVEEEEFLKGTFLKQKKQCSLSLFIDISCMIDG